MAVHDVKCKACGAIEEVVTRGDSIANCSCGGERTITFELWGKGRERKADGFTPVEIGGERFDTREGWENYRRQWKETHGEELHVRGASQREIRAAAEERLHNNIERLRREERLRGFDNAGRIRDLQSTRL